MLKDFTKEDLVKEYKEQDVLNLRLKSIYNSMQNWDAKQWALFEHCGRDLDMVDDINLLDDIDTDEFDFNGETILVLTDDEADNRWDEELDYYLEDCVYPDLPENLKYYFDDEKWKNDARMDGRGHAVAHYDGEENEYKIEFDDDSECWIFIYRM